MGAPAFQYAQTFENNDVQVYSANFPLYGDMSNRVMSILGEYSPDIEIYSIDEAFLKLEGFQHFDFLAYGKAMHKQVLQWTGIPTSIGIASTKSLAKVANRIAKKFPDKTQNVYIIDSDEKRIKALKWLPIEDVWGIGRQHAKRLRAMHVNTAYDFTQLHDSWVKKHLSIVGMRLKQDLQGIPRLDLETVQPKKNIATTRTFEHNYTQKEQVQERITTFAVSCAEKLRKQKSCCNTLMVFVRTNRHRDDMAQYNRNIVIKLPYPTNSGIKLAQFANQALDKIFVKGYAYKKAGVIVMDFTPEKESQLCVFENSNPKHIPLMQAIDKINNSLGQAKVKLASQDLKRTWKMKQERLSPRYTTNLNDVITIKV